MAFWKKSEDPWDMKAGPMGTASPAAPARDEKPEPSMDSVRNWVEKKRAAKAEKLMLPAETCPWCGREMEQGFLSGGRGVYWVRGIPDTKTKWLGAGEGNTLRVGTEGVLYTYQTAWACRNCHRLVTDLPEPPADHFSQWMTENTETENADIREGEH